MNSDAPLSDQAAVDTIRALSMDAVQKANSGHPGTPMSLAPLGWTLYSKVMRFDPARPDWAGRDRFVLSCGHASMLQYALLHLGGFDLSVDDIKAFRQWHSKTPGHPENFETPGIETTTGPLGQGVGNAVGMAMAAEHLAARFGGELFDQRIWCIASDGDLMEGVASEAASIAGHLGLGRLTVFWDDNSITIDGRTDIAFTEDVVARFASYGWHTLSVDDGNDMAALEAAAKAALADPRPTFVRVKTIIGFPAPNKQDTPKAHGSPLGDDEIAATKAAMGWTLPPFEVPPEVTAMRAQLQEQGAKLRAEWEKKLTASPHRAAIEGALSGALPELSLPAFEASEKGMATRAASGKVIMALSEQLEGLVGGSADLTGSNKTAITGGSFTREQSDVPRTAHWGVREHGMGAAINGMALFGGLRPFGATFLIFSDYCRPSIRLAALMKLPVMYVFSHDSIGLGEDGPTHQPVEQLAALRAIPGFAVFRPADANEVRECWKAMVGLEGPSCIVTTRQSVPTLDRTAFASEAGVHRGAYAVRDDEGAEVVLIGTGSELQLAVAAGERLASEGKKVRVVSVPCWQLFDAQDLAYREALIPANLPAVVVEAGIRQGWDRYVGPRSAFVTLEHFGASASYETLYEEFGITADAVYERAKALLG
ncbi:MAG: transketolase [Myxococcota bacterium]